MGVETCLKKNSIWVTTDLYPDRFTLNFLVEAYITKFSSYCRIASAWILA